MTTPLNGAIGGMVAALSSAVIVRLLRVVAVHGTAGLNLQRFRVHQVWALVLLFYGSLAAVILFTLDTRLFGVLSVPPSTIEAIGVAAIWSVTLGMAVAAIGPIVWGMRVGQARRIDILGFHLIYGLFLGIWIRLTWIT